MSGNPPPVQLNRPPAASPRNSGIPMADAAYREEDFPALRLARGARVVRRLGRVLLGLLLVAVLAMLLAPWQQSIRGEGSIIAFDPFERPQPVDAPVKGRVAERGEGVAENAYVKEGQLLFRLENQDAMYLARLEQQVELLEGDIRAAESRLEQEKALLQNNQDAVKATAEELSFTKQMREDLLEANNQLVKQASNKLKAARSKLRQAQAKEYQAMQDYTRQKNLANEGIATVSKMQSAELKHREAAAGIDIAEQEIEAAQNGLTAKEKERDAKREEMDAKIQNVANKLQKAHAEVAKAQSMIFKTTGEINQKQGKLVDQESKVATQMTQEVRAPCDGYVQNLAVFQTSSIVKPGDQLCRVVPEMTQPAVEILVSGNDMPLIAPGEHVRLQFEGWPAVQFSGWPSVAVGTFGGEVALVESTDNGMGKFRVVVVPDPTDQPWPEFPYLRQGVRSYGWVLLDQVPLGFEVWRRMNGFPPTVKGEADQSKSNQSKAPKIKI